MGNDDDLEQRFQQAISGADLADLRALVPHLLGHARARAERPDLRHPPLREPVTFRVRVDIARAHPPIWRRLDIRSDVALDVVHQVLQSSFDWADYHLHRFSLGGDGFDDKSQLFLCPFDVDEGDEDGMPAAAVRLDEAMQRVGDLLHYLYDYGDNWDLTLRLEQVMPSVAGAPIATCIDGRRAAPPEDCGGLRDAATLAEVLEDPSAFSVTAVNDALSDPYFVLRDGGLMPDLVDVLNRLSVTGFGPDLAARAMGVASAASDISEDTLREGLRPVLWFLDRAAEAGGFELTAAGYLKPADVVAATDAVPTLREEWGQNNREIQAHRLLHFRAELQRLGLLRKYRGRLMVTKKGDAARGDVGKLWAHLAQRLVPSEGGDRFLRESTLLVLLHVASGRGEPADVDRIAAMLAVLGWRHSDGTPLSGYELWHMPGNAFTLLEALGAERVGRRRKGAGVSDVAVALAREAIVPR